MPTVLASIRSVLNFSMMTFVPLRDSNPALPPVIGMVLAGAPSTTTVIWCVPRSAFMTTDWPTVNPPEVEIWP